MRTTLGVLALMLTLFMPGTPSARGLVFRLEVGPSVAGNSTRVKKAAVVIRSLACDPATVTMTGTAEGIVNDRRQSMPLTVVPLETPGVYAVPRIWEQGRWVLSVTATCGERKAVAAAVVPLGPAGLLRDSIQYLERAPDAAAIEVALRAAKQG